MKLKVNKLFRYQDGAITKELSPGTYKVPGEVSEYVAEIALKWGKAEIIKAKVAAKQKGNAPENKARMVK